MGLEPTTFCMANASDRSHPFAPRSLKPTVCRGFQPASERDRTRANAEPCHSCHGVALPLRAASTRSPQLRDTVDAATLPHLYAPFALEPAPSRRDPLLARPLG
jgi:hypothetical protein